MQKSIIYKSHRLSLPHKQKLRSGASMRQNQQGSLFSYKKIKKQTFSLDGFRQVQSKRVSLPNISFNIFKQKLAQYLRPSQNSYTQQSKYRYQQMCEMPPKKAEKCKITMFRNYKKNKMLTGFKQEITELSKDFNVKQLEIKNRLSINKQPTFQNIAVKRDCLRYFGQNNCFQKALQFRRKTPTPNKKQKLIQPSEKQKHQKQYIQGSLQYSAQDFQKIKVQPWRLEMQESEIKDFSQIQILQ